MAALKELLPQPNSSSTTYYDHNNDPWFKQRFTAAEEEKLVPPYLKRSGFVPWKVGDFGDGGAFLEIHVAQYSLDMGRDKPSKPGSNILPVGESSLEGDGNGGGTNGDGDGESGSGVVRDKSCWMEVILKEEEAADWIYRGEGAANLVLAYTGSSPAFIGKVMRIRKAPRDGAQTVTTRSPSALTAHERLLWKDVDELVSSPDNDIASQLSVSHVMKPLLGSKYVDAGMHVLVSRGFLESVEKNVICQRPGWRVDTAQVDMHSDSVLLMSDHSLFTRCNQGSSPSISVEIKPKCGFLPVSRFISEETAIKKRITRFEMHQALKLHQGEISLLSEYNPLDLFSGSKERILKAIKDLFTTPQNNFRVFMNGSLIFGGLGGGAEDTNFCIAKAFEGALKSVIQADVGLCTESFLTLIAEAVHKSGVLDRLLEVEKLDNVDIEGAIHAYYDITCQQCMVCRELSEEQVKKYSSLHSASLDESLRIVKDYLIAATAKDCSLMICFRPRKEGDSGSVCSNVYLESTKQSFDFKVYFIDLDLKRMSKMEEYYELDKKIVGCYIEMIKMDQGRNEVTNKQAS